jgi:hypothetical protein
MLILTLIIVSFTELFLLQRRMDVALETGVRRLCEVTTVQDRAFCLSRHLPNTPCGACGPYNITRTKGLMLRDYGCTVIAMFLKAASLNCCQLRVYLKMAMNAMLLLS